jgi:hypothetical protein
MHEKNKKKARKTKEKEMRKHYKIGVLSVFTHFFSIDGIPGDTRESISVDPKRYPNGTARHS